MQELFGSAHGIKLYNRVARLRDAASVTDSPGSAPSSSSPGYGGYSGGYGGYSGTDGASAAAATAPSTGAGGGGGVVDARSMGMMDAQDFYQRLLAEHGSDAPAPAFPPISASSNQDGTPVQHVELSAVALHPPPATASTAAVKPAATSTATTADDSLLVDVDDESLQSVKVLS